MVNIIKQQYDLEVKIKEESRFKGFNLFNKKDKEKDDGLSL